MSRIMRSKGDRPEFVFKILSWVYHALRPLQMVELLEILDVEDEDKELTSLRTPASRVVAACESMIDFDETDGIVRFAHYTVQDFDKK